MRWIQAGAAAAALLVGPALADDAQQTAMKTMHEAMVQQASMPATPPVMPDHSTMDPAAMQQHMATQHKRDQAQKGEAQQGAQMAQEMQHRRAMQHPEQAAHQQAVMHGAKDANTVRADMANRAAMGAAMGGAASAMGQGNADSCNAAGMNRTKNPGSGMMGGGGMMGGSGSGDAGGMGGGMPPASGTSSAGTGGTGTMGTGTTTGTGSMPAGGAR